jgi:hypothetical protein
MVLPPENAHYGLTIEKALEYMFPVELRLFQFEDYLFIVLPDLAVNYIPVASGEKRPLPF